MADQPLRVTCCIAGGGPAGVMLGFLLARAGVDVAVLERHKDFFRDFRGDTIHPSTLQVMHELGLLDAFLKVPHDEIRRLRALIGDTEIQIADFTHLPTVCKFIALMPQWDFLNFLSEQGKRYPGFGLYMGTDATDLIVEGIQGNERVVGLRANARCVKNRVAPPLGETELEIRYPLGAKLLSDHQVRVAEIPSVRVEELECESAVV